MWGLIQHHGGDGQEYLFLSTCVAEERGLGFGREFHEEEGEEVREVECLADRNLCYSDYLLALEGGQKGNLFDPGEDSIFGIQEEVVRLLQHMEETKGHYISLSIYISSFAGG